MSEWEGMGERQRELHVWSYSTVERSKLKEIQTEVQFDWKMPFGFFDSFFFSRFYFLQFIKSTGNKFFLYLFVFSDDYNRVVLEQIDNIPDSDYINASYVDVSDYFYVYFYF